MARIFDSHSFDFEEVKQDFAFTIAATLERRRGDWIAYLKDNPDICEAGNTGLEALTRLAQTIDARVTER
jgi:predicted RNase H-like HicB family nuclease